MKLKDGFITHESDGEQILIDAGSNNFSGLVKSNSTAAFIVDCLKSETSEKEILEKMLDNYYGDEKAMEDSIKKVIDKLRSIGAIDE